MTSAGRSDIRIRVRSDKWSFLISKNDVIGLSSITHCIHQLFAIRHKICNDLRLHSSIIDVLGDAPQVCFQPILTRAVWSVGTRQPIPQLTRLAHLHCHYIFSPEYTYFFAHFFWCIAADGACALGSLDFLNKILWVQVRVRVRVRVRVIGNIGVVDETEHIENRIEEDSEEGHGQEGGRLSHLMRGRVELLGNCRRAARENRVRVRVWVRVRVRILLHKVQCDIETEFRAFVQSRIDCHSTTHGMSVVFG